MQPNQSMQNNFSNQQNQQMQQQNFQNQQNFNNFQNQQMQQQNFQNQPMQQNNQMNQNFQSQPNPQMQQNFQNQQNNQMNQNFQSQQNPQMQQQNFQNQQPMQQNNQMNQNPQMPQNFQNQQMQQQNFQNQPNPPMNQNPQMNQNTQMNQSFQNQPIQQNNHMNQNQQMQQNFQSQPNPQMQQQNFQNQSNPQIQQQNFQNQSNPQIQQQNFQSQPNPQMQQQNFQNQPNPQMQQQNIPLTGSQSRPLPPKIPRNSSQSFAPPVTQMSSQRIPLRSTSSMQSGGSMSLNQSMKYSSMQSMQSIGSSDSEEMQDQHPLSRQNSTQTFPIVYNNITYKADPELLSNASPKFKELIQPFVQQNRLSDVHLEVLCHNFTYRSINNFLKLCQNLPTDVENSEMKEICEIAKLFGAEKIYNTGVAFIRQNIDPNFSVPDNKYDGSDGKRYLFIEDERHVISHSSDMTSNMNAEEDEESDDANDDVKQNPTTTVSNKSENKQSDANSEDSKSVDPSRLKSVIYRVKVENHTFRCPVFHFYDDKNVLFTAKQKANNIFVGEGYDVHIKSNQKNHVAHIYQDDCSHNIIFLKDKNFKLKYVNSGKPNHLSINVTFPLNDEKEITWTPKQPKYDPMTDKYYLNFHGEHHHTPIKSRKNIVLQNSNGHPTFIVRKMDNEMFEIECLPLVDPLIAFIIGLSDIVGPYMDPMGEIEF